jgi:hypothetical protein
MRAASMLCAIIALGEALDLAYLPLTHLPDTIGAAAQTFVTNKVDINIQTAHMPQTIKQKTAPINIQEIRNLPMCLARRNG